MTQTVVMQNEVPVDDTLVNPAFSYDNFSDCDQIAATTAMNMPQDNAFICGYVSSSTVDVPLAGAPISTFSSASGFFGILIDAGSRLQGYIVFLRVPSVLFASSPSVVGVANVMDSDARDVLVRTAAPSLPGFGRVKGVVFNDINGDGDILHNIFSGPGISGVSAGARSRQSAAIGGDGRYYFLFLMPAGPRTVVQTNLAG